MPYIHILEQTTWLTAGLREAFPEWQTQILYRDRAEELMSLDRLGGPGLQMLDFDALPLEAAKVLRNPPAPIAPLQIALIGREQHPVRWEILQTGCPCLLEKPLPISEIARICRQMLERRMVAAHK